jgi:hypothetical protein
VWHSAMPTLSFGISPAFLGCGAQRLPLPLCAAHGDLLCPGRIGELLADPQILETHVRATAGVNALEGVGMIEAPRGTLIHHYKVNEEGAITWANLIVATGHNNLPLAEVCSR